MNILRNIDLNAGSKLLLIIFLLLVTVLAQRVAFSSEYGQRFHYRNHAGFNLGISLFSSRNAFAAGDVVDAAESCELGIPEICYHFGGILFAVPVSESDVLRLDKENKTSLVTVLRIIPQTSIFGRETELLVIESKNPVDTIIFYYSFEFGILAFMPLKDGEPAVFLSVGQCGFGAIAPPCVGTEQ